MSHKSKLKKNSNNLVVGFTVPLGLEGQKGELAL